MADEIKTTEEIKKEVPEVEETAESILGLNENRKIEEPITEAEAKKKSNCSHCAIGHDANKTKIWQLSEMDADHVSAWSKGGKTVSKNCQMLCKTHNRAKGNR